MYPIYPLLAFAAALSVSTALKIVGMLFGTTPASTSSSMAKLLRRGAMMLLFAGSAALFFARVASSHTNYGGTYIAQMQIRDDILYTTYQHLSFGFARQAI